MPQAWITNSSTTLEAMINPINAACQDGYVPTDVYRRGRPSALAFGDVPGRRGGAGHGRG